MSLHPNTERLLTLMDEVYRVSPKEVAALTKRAYNTVLQWRSCRSQVISDTMLDYLELKLAAKYGGGNHVR